LRNRQKGPVEYNMILSNARRKIERYNELCLHYNLVANSVYEARTSHDDPFSIDYLPYLVASLIAFDMGRMMGKGPEGKYDVAAGGFATRLYEKVQTIKPSIQHLNKTPLCDLEVGEEATHIRAAYEELAAGGPAGLNQQGNEFHVGATKILHFINPELFLIIDRNTAQALRASHGIAYRNAPQPGYSATRYLECLASARADIINFGVDDICSLDVGVPMARIYDKLSFATGIGWP
jgi:hypothetical protein